MRTVIMSSYSLQEALARLARPDPEIGELLASLHDRCKCYNSKIEMSKSRQRPEADRKQALDVASAIGAEMFALAKELKKADDCDKHQKLFIAVSSAIRDGTYVII
jgi:hypothetical protein